MASQALAPGASTEGIIVLEVTGAEGWVTYAPPGNGPLWTWEIPSD